jgi:hypothetical protein
MYESLQKTQLFLLTYNKDGVIPPPKEDEARIIFPSHEIFKKIDS